jgi:hypothetical protein
VVRCKHFFVYMNRTPPHGTACVQRLDRAGARVVCCGTFFSARDSHAKPRVATCTRGLNREGVKEAEGGKSGAMRGGCGGRRRRWKGWLARGKEARLSGLRGSCRSERTRRARVIVRSMLANRTVTFRRWQRTPKRAPGRSSKKAETTAGFWLALARLERRPTTSYAVTSAWALPGSSGRRCSCWRRCHPWWGRRSAGANHHAPGPPGKRLRRAWGRSTGRRQFRRPESDTPKIDGHVTSATQRPTGPTARS